MGSAVIDALRAAIEAKKRELAELERAVAKYEAELSSPDGKVKRYRRSPGFKQNSIPYHVHAILSASATGPMSAADIADALKAKGKDVDSRLISASIARYIDKVFRRDEEGRYLLVR
jgi:ribosomal protein L9